MQDVEFIKYKLKSINKTTAYKLICFGALAVLIVLLVPMLAVGKCMVMTGDDYSFSTYTHQAVQNGGSVIGAAIEKTREVYYSWQGSFAAVFLMTLQPGIFGYQYYWLTTPIMLLTLCAGLLYFCTKFFAVAFGTNKYGAAFVAIVIAIFATQFLPLAYQSFYWYNGSVYYTFFFGIELITIGLCIAYVHDGSKWKAVLTGILSFIIGGGNYVTALLGLLMLSLAIISLAAKNNKKYRFFALILAVLLISFIISATAPGNSVRQAENPDHPGAVAAVLASLRYGMQYIKRWSNLPFVAMVLILSPVLWDMSGKSRKHFSNPVLVSILSYLLFSSMFCPHTYAMGSPGPERILNIIYFAFLLLCSLNLFWWMGWIQKKINNGRIDHIILLEGAVSAVALALIVVSVRYTSNPAKLTSAIALNEIRSGEAFGYYEENVYRFKVLEDETAEDVHLSPLKNMPVLLFSEDMKADPDNYMNRDAATYFNKNSVSVY